MIDIGANLTNGQFRRDLPQVLRRAAQAGVEAVVVTGTSVTGSRQAVQLAQRHGSEGVALFATVGVHPHDAKEFDDRSTIAEMRSLIEGKDGAVVVAVGECGLDFNRDYSPRDAQIRAFQAQVSLACELQLPLFLHEREAHAALVEVLQPFVETGRLPPTVVHCFTGKEQELRTYLGMGFYIGLTGFVCMEPRGLAVRAMVQRIPIDRLMIETDAPFMYPYSGNKTKKRSRCEPKDLRAVVQTLASCYSLHEDEVARCTTANARRFFGLDERMADSLAESKPAEPSVSMQVSGNQDGVKDMVVLNGGDGEGGGQVLRISTALAAVMRRAVRVHSIRANRKVPGLRNQHLGTIELVNALSVGGILSGAQLNSKDLTFDARGALLNGGSSGGAFNVSSHTGGSVSLMIQGALPVLAFRGPSTLLTLRGGTHMGFSPTIDFIQTPLRALLARFGLSYEVEVSKRMFFPGPGGEVRVSMNQVEGEMPLQAVDLSESSSSIRRVLVRVTAFGSSATERLADQYASALKTALVQGLSSGQREQQLVVDVECVVEATPAAVPKAKSKFKGKKPKEKTAVSAIVVLETATGGLLSLDRTRGITECSVESLAAEMASTLGQHVSNGVCVDEHLADNVVVFMALAHGTSRLRVPCKAQRLSLHLETALEVAARLTGATYRFFEDGATAVVEVDGIGLQRQT
ncbi:hypothetical protein BBJ28_00006909 [Nothophytophthora sp. Chile5]|nr:hypothetical protein BBJ28_00006909 [Nothophytophthora sp. Chile5]